MAQEYALSCMMCGEQQMVDANSASELEAAKHGGSVHICETCKRKVQFESEQKFK